MHRAVTTGVVMAALLSPMAAAAQDTQVEINVFGGFTSSEGVPVRPQAIGGETFDRVTPKSGSSYGVN